MTPYKILKDKNKVFPDIIVYQNKCKKCGKKFESVEFMSLCVDCEWDDIIND